jgi:hypothetical protein
MILNDAGVISTEEILLAVKAAEEVTKTEILMSKLCRRP